MIPLVFPLLLRVIAYSRISFILNISFIDSTYLLQNIASRSDSFTSYSLKTKKLRLELRFEVEIRE